MFSHKPGSRLSLISDRPAVSSPAMYCLKCVCVWIEFLPKTESGMARNQTHNFSIKNRRPCSDLLLVFTDVTIIESKIEIEFFFENRIESKSIFWLAFFRFW